MSTEILQLGAVAIIFLFAIKEFFAWLKARKNDNNGWDKKVFQEIKLLNQNHLHSIEKSMGEDNDRIVNAITSGNQKIVQLLGEIKGKLSK